MTPKEKRERLLKNRPFIRPLRIYDGSYYHKDIGILWAAHKAKPFYSIDKKIDQNEFATIIEGFSKSSLLFIADDDCQAFDSGRGPVCLISVSDNGWRVEPHCEFFNWASKRNILRVIVSFLHWMHYKKIGVCVVRCMEESKGLFDHCKDYGVLFYVGKIIGGDERGDEYIFSIMGKANPKRNRSAA